MQTEPQRWLRMENSDTLLYAEPPEIQKQGANVELRFIVPDATARLLLERIAKASGSTVAVTQ